MSEQEQLAQLRRLMIDYFNEDELRSLCFDLGKPYEQLSGSETESKTRELLAWCDRHNRLPDLYALLEELRPRVEWGQMPLKSRKSVQLTIFPLHNLPFQRNPNFTGRIDLLSKLRQTLSDNTATAVPVVVAGLGGVGKTQLVLEYTYRFQKEYDLIWWLNAEDTTALDTDFSVLASTLALVKPAAMEQEVLVNLVLRWLTQTDHSSLLIFDNADTLNSARMQSYLPKGGSGHLMITSKNPNWGSLANVLNLDIFSAEEAVTFLQQRSPRATIEDLQALAQALGYFPLALAHAAAYVETTGCTFSDYLELYTGRRQALWQRAQPPSNYHATISTTWDLAFQKVRQHQPAALALLNLCCFLAADNIPLSLLRAHADQLPDELAATTRDLLALDDAIAALRRYSMLEREGDRLSLHRLVQTVTRDRMEEEEERFWLDTAVNLIAEAWPFQDHNLATWEPSQQLLPHLLTVAEHAQNYQIKTAAVADIYYQAGLYLHLHGDLTGARPYYERALAVCETVWGADHPDTARAYNKLGHLSWDTNDLEQARAHLEGALAIREATFGSTHPDVADSLDLLGNLLAETGNYKGARPYYERALAIREKALGPQHPETGQSLNNLAVTLHALGEMKAAQHCFERAIAIWEKDPGPNHPKICQGLYGHGKLLKEMGHLDQAQTDYERALAIWEEAYGPNHPHTAYAHLGLGNLLRDKDELQAARPYLERALTVWENALGPHHLLTSYSLISLGKLLQAMGDLEGARTYFERALSIRQTILGADHPLTKEADDLLAEL